MTLSSTGRRHPAWNYRGVHELLFEAGHLEQARDLSPVTAELRTRLQRGGGPDGGIAFDSEIREWLRSCFSRDYAEYPL
jgi:hypothetical protein